MFSCAKLARGQRSRRAPNPSKNQSKDKSTQELSGPDPLRFLRVALRIEISTRCVFCVAGRIFIGFLSLPNSVLKLNLNVPERLQVEAAYRSKTLAYCGSNPRFETSGPANSSTKMAYWKSRFQPAAFLRSVFWATKLKSDSGGRPESNEKSDKTRLGQESCRPKVSWIFWYFVPSCAPNFAPNFPRIFRGFFALRFVGDGDQKNSPKIPAIFQCKIPRQTRKKYSLILLESRQSKQG